MSTVKISQLAEITQLNANTANSLFMGVDLPTGVTGKFTAHVLAAGLYSNEVLNVGNNAIVLPDVAGQFAGTSEAYVQINHQNLNGNGSGDIVVTANMGTDSTYYIDMGMNGNTYNYDGFTYAKPLDGYLIVQGDTESDPGGNLVIGTTTAGKDISFVNGSIDESEIVMKYQYHEGFKLLQKPLFFADGSSQNTAAVGSDITIASFTLANSVNVYARTANTFLQANDATTLALATSRGQANAGAALAAAKVYTDTANTFLQANDFTTFTESKAYTDWIVAANTITMYNYSGTAYDHANAANILASAAYTHANTTATALTVTDSVAQGAFTRATAANNKMQSAYDLANTALVNYTVSDIINTAEMGAGGLHINFEDGFGLTGYVDIDTLGNIVSLGDVTASDIVANNSITANVVTISDTTLGTASVGNIEYDGRSFYMTPSGEERGVVPNKQIFYNKSAVVLANNETQQSILGLENGVAVTGGTRYAFTIKAIFFAAADSVNLFFATGGTATYSSTHYWADVGKAGYLGTFSAVNRTRNSFTSDGQIRDPHHISYGLVGGTYWETVLHGVIDVTDSGYLLPIIAFSPVPGANPNVQSGTYMEIYPIGTSGAANTAVGNWS